ncbi:MAG: hypothetical protein DCC51_15205 [Anaerolineae bacterium]|nr:MAG: hypothetical protein DCC51_15205 [Anaerolineae bacterium]
MNRRHALRALTGLTSLAVLPRLTFAAREAGIAGAIRPALIGAAWRGPNKGDPHFAGALEADWSGKAVAIRHAVALPGRAHGVIAEPAPFPARGGRPPALRPCRLCARPLGALHHRDRRAH